MLKVFYIVEYTNEFEWKSEIGFYDKKEAEKFLNINHLCLFDGKNGYKIKEEFKREDIKIYTTVEQCLIDRKNKETEQPEEVEDETE